METNTHSSLASTITAGPIETAFRSVWFWLGVIACCYGASGLWLGELFAMVPEVVLAAPSGLLHVLRISGFDNGIDVFERALKPQLGTLLALSAAHLAFWSVLIALITRRRRIDRARLLQIGWTILIVLAVNLAGCASMKYST